MAKSKRKGLLLRESDETEGFTTLDLVNGLHGVCWAADQTVEMSGANEKHKLAMAAKILSSILAARVEI